MRFRFLIHGLLAGLVLATGALSAARSQAAAPTTVTMIMDWPSPWMGWAPFVVADAKGYFKRAGITLKMETPGSSADPARVLASGHVDVAFTTILDVIEARAQNAPITSVGAYAQYNNWGIIKWRSDPITPAQLKGKSIGIYPDAWSRAQLTIMLHHFGIGIDQVKLITASSDVVPLLLAHKVDVITGVTNAEQTEAETNGHKPTTMYLASRYGVPNSYVQVLAANEHFLQNNPALARAWVKAVMQGIRYARAHPQETWTIFNKRYPNVLDKNYGLRSWESTIPLFVSQATLVHGLLWQNAAVWQQTENALKQYKIIDRTVPVANLYTNNYL